MPIFILYLKSVNPIYFSRSIGCHQGGGVMARDVPAAPSAPRLLDQVRDVIRLKHYSIRTEQSYLGWIRRFILFQAHG